MGKINSFNIDVITPNAHGQFNKSSDFHRKSDVKSFRDVLAVAVANETTYKMNKGVKEAADENLKKKPISITEIKKQNEITIGDLRKEYYGQTNKMSVNNVTTSKIGKVPQIYFVIARTFYNIIARTPYDEDYAYTSKKKVARKNRNKNILGGYVFRYTKGYHHKDDDVVKDEWNMELVVNKKTFLFTKNDFEDLKFESIINKEYEKMARAIYKIVHSETVDDIKIFNTNPRVDLLEFGQYKKKRNDITKNEIHQGKKRLHGTWHGYSVQAPRGFLALTLNELKETEVEYETNPDELSDEFVRFTVKDIMANKTLKFGSNVSLDDPIRKHVKEFFDKSDFFNEKDILGLFYKHGGNGKITVKKNLKMLNDTLTSRDRAEFADWKKEESELKKIKKDVKARQKKTNSRTYKDLTIVSNLTVETPSQQEYKTVKQIPLTEKQVSSKLDYIYKKAGFEWIKQNISDTEDEEALLSINGRITVGKDWYQVVFEDGQFKICKFPNTEDSYEFITPNTFFYEAQINNIEEILATFIETERWD